jgi:hypothetical protein
MCNLPNPNDGKPRAHAFRGVTHFRDPAARIYGVLLFVQINVGLYLMCGNDRVSSMPDMHAGRALPEVKTVVFR